MTSDPTNPERETKTPEADEDWTRAEGLKDSTRALVMRNRARKLELARDSARAEAEQLRERCKRLEATAAAMVLWYDCDDGTVSMEASIEALRTALNQPKP